MGCNKEDCGGGRMALGMKDEKSGMEVMVTFDPFIYEPADVAEIEDMLIRVVNKWWEGRAFRNANPSVYSSRLS